MLRSRRTFCITTTAFVAAVSMSLIACGDSSAPTIVDQSRTVITLDAKKVLGEKRSFGSAVPRTHKKATPVYIPMVTERQ